MYRITATYHHPDDPQQFLDHYRATHSRLATQLPGLRNYEWGQCETLDGSRSPHFLVAIMDWDTKEDAISALASPEGQAAAADMGNFAQAGADVSFHEVVTPR
ncbi:EthD family reductase [Georgenia sp. AZ-5]|uniref:EthD family reductase n=1 Tax=Georgenia sp. AZ-5 TaxID=3367526 RepID=UPI003754F4CF